MMYVHLRFRGLQENTKVQVPRFAIIPEDCFPTLLELSGVCQLEHLITS